MNGGKFKFYDLVIYADRGSSSARRLATALGSRRWRSDLPERYTRRRPYFRGNTSPLVINWGSSVHPRWLEDSRYKITPHILNHGDRVAEAIDKLAFFRKASGIDGFPLPKWTTERDLAAGWIGKGTPVVCRRTLRGSSGAGISLARTVDELVDAPLYTRFYPKTHEFRVHVFNGKVVDITQKKLKGGPNADANRFVRSLCNGWIHAHAGLDLLESDREKIGTSCCLCVSSLGLDFGAVDVMAILNEPTAESPGRTLKNFVICEVNTGPGLENTQTINAYASAILEIHRPPVTQSEVSST